MAKPKQNKTSQGSLPVFIVFLVPTLMLLVGYVVNPFPPSETAQVLANIPLFLGLVLLGVGFILKNKPIGSLIKIAGWGSFSFYWALTPSYLYFSEGGDVFNATVAIAGVYVLVYIAYHEWLSYIRKESISCLNWIAGGSFIAGIIYFSVDTGIVPQLKESLIDVVAAHSAGLMNLLGLQATKTGSTIAYSGEYIAIIFACTAIQAMVLFLGMIGALSSVGVKRRLPAILVSVVPIYFLNLVRNASVIYLVGEEITSFNIAHNYLAKAGALITLVVILFLVFKVLPELYDEISCLFNLRKRNGPVEILFAKLGRGKRVQ